MMKINLGCGIVGELVTCSLGSLDSRTSPTRQTPQIANCFAIGREPRGPHTLVVSDPAALFTPYGALSARLSERSVERVLLTDLSSCVAPPRLLDHVPQVAPALMRGVKIRIPCSVRDHARNSSGQTWLDFVNYLARSQWLDASIEFVEGGEDYSIELPNGAHLTLSDGIFNGQAALSFGPRTVYFFGGNEGVLFGGPVRPPSPNELYVPRYGRQGVA